MEQVQGVRIPLHLIIDSENHFVFMEHIEIQTTFVILRKHSQQNLKCEKLF